MRPLFHGLSLCLTLFLVSSSGIAGVKIPAPKAGGNEMLRPVGRYSGILTRANSQKYALRLDLWMKESKPTGIVTLQRKQLSRDAPIGLTEKVIFNSKSKFFSFRTRLTVGIDRSLKSSQSGLLSRDRIEFEGEIGSDQITGGLQWYDELRKDSPFEQIEFVLKKEKQKTLKEENFSTWRERWQMILDLRGPRW